MKRRFIVLILFAIATLIFVVLSVAYSPRSSSGNGILTIRTEPEDLAVLIDDAVLGKTPLENISIKSGQHLVSIGDNWKEQILIAKGYESVIIRNFSYGVKMATGYSIGYEVVGNIFGKPTQLVITSTPSNSNVFQGETTLGSTPLLITKDQFTDQPLRIVKDGYEESLVSLNIKDDMTMRLDVNLMANPVATLGKVDIGSRVQSYTLDPNETLIINPRYSWGSNLTLEKDPVVTPWNKIEVWGIQQKSKVDNETMISLDDFFKVKYKLPGIPFAYVINSQGEIFEGLGIYDYDYSGSGFENATFTAGSAPVLVFFDQGIELNENMLKSLKWLTRYFEQDPTLSARFVSNLDLVTIKAGETKTIELQWQNTSSLIWRRDTFYQVLIVTPGSVTSEFYDPSLWKSINQIARFNEEVVLPGAIATFSIPLKAPYYSGDFTQDIELFDVSRNAVIAGTSQTINLRVTEGTDKVLIVKETPTGFLNVRSGPGTNFQLLTTLFVGEKVAWVKEEGGWFQIILRDGASGWVTNTYVEVR